MYKFIILIIILFGFSTKSNAQYSGMSFEVHYPIIFSDEANTYSDTEGVLGGTLQYQFTDNIPFNFGVEYKFDLIQAVEQRSELHEPTKINFLISNINVFSKMLFITHPELQLYVAGGFSQYKYSGGETTPSYLGFNFGSGLTYDIFDKIYLLSSYSYIQTSLKQNEGGKLKDKQQLIRVGFGFKF